MVEFQLRQFEPQIQHLKAQFASTKSDEALVTFNPVCGILNQNVIFSEPLPSVFLFLNLTRSSVQCCYKIKLTPKAT